MTALRGGFSRMLDVRSSNVRSFVGSYQAVNGRWLMKAGSSSSPWIPSGQYVDCSYRSKAGEACR